MGKKLNKKVAFLDTALIHSFIVVPITYLIVWLLQPILFEYYLSAINKNIESYSVIVLSFLVNIFIFNYQIFDNLVLFSILFFMITFKIINIINAIKLKKYSWAILMLIIFPMEIIYYFLIGRKSIKNKEC